MEIIPDYSYLNNWSIEELEALSTGELDMIYQDMFLSWCEGYGSYYVSVMDKIQSILNKRKEV